MGSPHVLPSTYPRGADLGHILRHPCVMPVPHVLHVGQGAEEGCLYHEQRRQMANFARKQLPNGSFKLSMVLIKHHTLQRQCVLGSNPRRAKSKSPRVFTLVSGWILTSGRHSAQLRSRYFKKRWVTLSTSCSCGQGNGVTGRQPGLKLASSQARTCSVRWLSQASMAGSSTSSSSSCDDHRARSHRDVRLRFTYRHTVVSSS